MRKLLKLKDEKVILIFDETDFEDLIATRLGEEAAEYFRELLIEKSEGNDD